MIYTDINEIQGEYELILADPPWKINKSKRKTRPISSMSDIDYPTMSLSDIKEHLKIASKHTSENAIMFLWTIEKYLYDALELLKELGWQKHIVMIWNKGRGMAPAYSVRFTHEYLIYAFKGKFECPVKEAQGKIGSVFTGSSHRHSEKPVEAYEIIETLYPSKKKLEMYARSCRTGWDSFGNELESEVDGYANKDEPTSS